MNEKLTGVKYDNEKIPLQLIPSAALFEIGKAYQFGAKKYSAENWRGGFDWKRIIGSALRHLFAWKDGEDKDPESGLSHLAHLGFCVLTLLEYEVRKAGNDDRYKCEPIALGERKLSDG